MTLGIDDQELKKFIMVGDKVLIKPKSPKKQTQSGLYLPPTVSEKEQVLAGYVLKTGPGYPIPAVIEEDEHWKENRDEVKYVPIQPKEGDLAVYMQNSAIEIEYKKEKLVIVSQSSILFLIRDKGLFE